jgi:PAS domain S-box-containing protein
VVFHGADGRVIDCNPAAQQILGLSRDEILGRSSVDPRWESVHEDGSAFHGERHPAMITLRTGQALSGQTMGVRAAVGSLRWISVNSNPIRREGAQAPVGAVVTFTDITARKAIEQRLRALTLEQERMLDNELIGIVKVHQRRVIWMNRGVSRIFGYTESELLGQPTRILYANDRGFLAAGEAIYGRAAGKPLRFTVDMVRKDGTPVPVELSSTVLSEDPYVVLGLLVDITPLRVAEAARVKALQLEAESRQRELEFAEEHRLRLRSQQHAQELDRLLAERSEMLDVLAHEVRQPLNNASAALQSANAALDGAHARSAAPALARAQAVLGRVAANIDNLLAVASLLARAHPVDPEDEDIDTLLAVAIGDMPEPERARVRVERCTDTRTASMDMSLMRLALRNLLSNALRHGSAAEAVVLRVADSDEPLALLIDVIDAGPGIAADLVPRLFERSRPRPAHSAQRGGLGLGLYIVRRVMDLHGGGVQLLRNDATGVTMRLVVQQSRLG